MLKNSSSKASNPRNPLKSDYSSIFLRPPPLDMLEFCKQLVKLAEAGKCGVLLLRESGYGGDWPNMI